MNSNTNPLRSPPPNGGGEEAPKQLEASRSRNGSVGVKLEKVSKSDRRRNYKRGSIVDRYRRASAFDVIVKDVSEKTDTGGSGDRIQKIQSAQKFGLSQDHRARMIAFEKAAEKIRHSERETRMSEDGEKMEEDEDEWIMNPYCVASMPEDIRRGFLRKVFGIVLIQLVLMAICISVIKYSGLGDLIDSFYWFVLVAYLSPYVAVGILMAVRKQAPWNMLAFSLFTISLSLLIGMVCYYLPGIIVFIAMGGVIFQTSAIMAYTIRPMEKFTFANVSLLILMIGATTSFVCWCISPNQPFMAYFWPGFASMIFGFWMIWDVVAIQIDLTPDEYIIGAVDIYLDIINLIIWLLICCLYCLEAVGKVAH